MHFALRGNTFLQAHPVQGFLQSCDLEAYLKQQHAVAINEEDARQFLPMVTDASPIALWDYPKGTYVVSVQWKGRAHFLPSDFSVDDSAAARASVEKYPECLLFVPAELQTESVQAAAYHAVCARPWLINGIENPSRMLQRAALVRHRSQKRFAKEDFITVYPSLWKLDWDILDEVKPGLSRFVKDSQLLSFVDCIRGLDTFLNGTYAKGPAEMPVGMA